MKNMNKYHVQKYLSHLEMWDNIGDFMRWGLEMTGKERTEQIIKEAFPIFESLFIVYIKIYNTLYDVFKPLFLIF